MTVTRVFAELNSTRIWQNVAILVFPENEYMYLRIENFYNYLFKASLWSVTYKYRTELF